LNAIFIFSGLVKSKVNKAQDEVDSIVMKISSQKEQIAGLGTDALTVDSLITIYNPCPTNCQCEDIPTVTIKLKDALNDMITCLCNARA
jgi:hypothetical protein